MALYFRLVPFGAISHNEETKGIFNRISADGVKTVSEFIRSAVVEYAENRGYICPFVTEREKPNFINDKDWYIFWKFQKGSRTVDYRYLLAFHWLKNLAQFTHIKNGDLIKIIIEDRSKVLV